jgi:hypothetical protein
MSEWVNPPPEPHPASCLCLACRFRNDLIATRRMLESRDLTLGFNTEEGEAAWAAVQQADGALRDQLEEALMQAALLRDALAVAERWVGPGEQRVMVEEALRCTAPPRRKLRGGR